MNKYCQGPIVSKRPLPTK